MTNSPTPPPSNQRRRLALVVGGLASLAAVAGVAVWLFLRGGVATDKSKTDDGKFVLPGKSPAPKSKRPPLIDLDAKEAARVKAMIDKGVAWLRKSKLEDGAWPTYHGHGAVWTAGVTALVGLTLLACGAKVDDPDVKSAAAYVRKAAPGVERTYEAALAVLFLDKLDDPADRATIATLVSRLIAGQSAKGAWAYYCKSLTEPEQTALLQAMRDLKVQTLSLLDQNGGGPEQEKLVQKVVAKLPPPLRELGVFHTPPIKAPEGYFHGGGDNSNTQFALLALWAARRRGLPVDRALQLAVRRFKETQNKEGTWGYGGLGDGAHPMPSMTCAGLLACAMEYGLKGRDEPVGEGLDANPQIKKGLAVIAESIAKLGNLAAVHTSPLSMYYMWSVERVGVLFHRPRIGAKDWYRWGLEILEHYQKEDGHWTFAWGMTTPVVDTCFALLFLQRADFAEDLTDKLTELGLAPDVGAVPRKE